MTERTAVSRSGVICTPNHQATDAGLAILETGGTAIDAMLAASATLAVTYPHMTGLGGDAIWLLGDGKKIDVITGIGQAGQRLPDGGHITMRGPASAGTTAGALRSWSLAKTISDQRWGSPLDWPTLLERSVYLARTGAPVTAGQAFWATQREDLIGQLPDLQALCCDAGGQLLAEGAMMRRPELAASLTRIASAGPDDFYDGELGAEIARGLRRLGCGLDAADLAATRARLEAPARIRYRQGWLFNAPSPTQGMYTLAALNSLNGFDMAAIANGSADYFHLLVEAIKIQLLRRNRELCDPDRGGPDGSRLLSADQARLDGRRLDINRARPWAEPGQPADTVWMAATDARGRSACLIQSLFHDFGSGCMAGDTGVLWLNRAAGFAADPDHVNAWAPGKRPAHTLNPSAYLADDGRQFYFGTQGGDGQPQTQMVVATQLIDYQSSPAQALTAPRFLLGRSFFDSTDNLKLEPGVGAAVAQELEGRGHQLEWVSQLSPLMGEAGVIAIAADGTRKALHDPRGQGTARALK